MDSFNSRILESAQGTLLEGGDRLTSDSQYNATDRTMKPSENMPSSDTPMRGTPLDYSHEMYLVYFEVAEYQGMARKVIEEYLGPERSKDLTELPFGYECELAIQCVPDIVRELAIQNIGVYQVVRYAKTKNMWK